MPSVQAQVAAAEASVAEIVDELVAASQKAKLALDLAQQAQNHYAINASEVSRWLCDQ